MKMTRQRGRAPCGKCLVAKIPHEHWQTTTFVAGLRSDGISAPLVVDAAMNGELFLAYVEQQLVPTLKSGDVVVMDNLAAHKVAGVRQAIERVGARLVYLPTAPTSIPSSKRSRNSNGSYAAPPNEPSKACTDAIELLSPDECQNYFQNAGYATGM